MPGVARALFRENLTNSGSSAKEVAFTNEAMTIVGAQIERLTVRGMLGRGKYGTIDEVEFNGSPGESFALKTIVEVCSSAVCGFFYLVCCVERGVMHGWAMVACTGPANSR